MKKGLLPSFTNYFSLNILFVRAVTLLLLIALNNQLAFAQEPSYGSRNIQWQKCLGGTKDDIANDVLVNTDGTIVVVGSSNSNDGDVTDHHGSLDTSDAWIAKMDASGTLLWQKSIGGTNADVFTSVISAGNGNYLCIGYTYSNNGDISFNNGNSDYFIVKISKDGNIIWSKTFGGTAYDAATSGVLTADGNYAIIGNTTSYDGDVQSKGFGRADEDAWAVKLDTGGNIIWENAVNYTYYGSNEPNMGFGIVENPNKTLSVLTNAYRIDTLSAVLVGTGDPPLTNYFYQQRYPPVLYQLNEINGQGSLYGGLDGEGDINFNNPTFNLCTSPAGHNFYVWESTSDNIYEDGYGICKDTTLAVQAAGNYTSYGEQVACDYYAGRNEFEIEQYGYGTHGISALTDSLYSTVGFFNNYYTDQYNPARALDGWLSLFGTFGGSYNDAFNSFKFFPNGNEFVAVGYTNSTDGDVSGLHGSAGGAYDCWIVKLANKNTITGNVFVDLNGNGIKDAGEPPFDQAKIASTKNGVAQYAIPNQGYYTNMVDTGTYTTTLTINQPYYTTTNTGTVTTFTSYGSSGTVNFPVRQIPGIKDYAVAVTSLESARPNFDDEYVITYSNKGTDTLINKTVYFIKDSRSQFGYATPPTANISGDTLSWVVTNVLPGNSGNINFYIKLDPIPLLNIGDTLISTVYIDSTGDASPSDNIVTLRQPVVGGFDPNDKEESHGGFITPDDMNTDKRLNYTIHFKNTGNQTTSNIIIRDTLDANLDWSSLQMISSSSTYQFTLQNGRYATWTFNNINLPDSITSDSLSNGYISYSINPVSSFVIGDTIRNSASIYFDFNPPLTTDTVITVFTSVQCVWTGTVSTAWENKANWKNGIVPDAGTDVYINSGTPYSPEISSKASCRLIYVNPNAALKVNIGNSLNVNKSYLPNP